MGPVGLVQFYSHCEDLVRGFCGTGVESGDLGRQLCLWCWLNLAMGNYCDVSTVIAISIFAGIILLFYLA